MPPASWATAPPPTPRCRAKVGAIAGIVAIAAGANHSLALRDSDSVWAWGANANGQLGNNSTTVSRVPVAAASALGGATAVAGGDAHSLAVLSDGSLRAWGSNGVGQVGDGSTGGSVLTPVAVSAPRPLPRRPPMGMTA